MVAILVRRKKLDACLFPTGRRRCKCTRIYILFMFLLGLRHIVPTPSQWTKPNQWCAKLCSNNHAKQVADGDSCSAISFQRQRVRWRHARHEPCGNPPFAALGHRGGPCPLGGAPVCSWHRGPPSGSTLGDMFLQGNGISNTNVLSIGSRSRLPRGRWLRGQRAEASGFRVTPWAATAARRW